MNYICVTCRYPFGKSTIPGNAVYCSRLCAGLSAPVPAQRLPQAVTTTPPGRRTRSRPTSAGNWTSRPMATLGHLFTGELVERPARPEPQPEPLTPVAAEPAAVMPEPVVICGALVLLTRCTKCQTYLSLRYFGRRLPTQCRGGCRKPRVKRTRNCGQCGKQYHPRHAGSRFCSRSCAGRKNRTCSRANCTRPHRAKGLCASCYNDTRYPDQRRQWPQRSAEEKRKADAIRNNRRRAAVHGVTSEKVETVKLGERDGWRCGICRRRINRELVWPDKRCPSVDHIIPLSLGGEHTYVNTRIAHLSCNVRRGNRSGPEQLALIG